MNYHMLNSSIFGETIVKTKEKNYTFRDGDNFVSPNAMCAKNVYK